MQRRPNVFDVGPTLYKCYIIFLCLLVSIRLYFLFPATTEPPVDCNSYDTATDCCAADEEGCSWVATCDDDEKRCTSDAATDCGGQSSTDCDGE